MTGANLLEPHLWAAGIAAVIVVSVFGWAIWKYRTVVAGDD